MNPIETDRRIEPYTVLNVGALLQVDETVDTQTLFECMDDLTDALRAASRDIRMDALTYGLVVVGEPWVGGSDDWFYHADDRYEVAVGMTVRVPGEAVGCDGGDQYAIANEDACRIPGMGLLLASIRNAVYTVKYHGIETTLAALHVEADLEQTRYEQMRDAIGDAYGPALARLDGALLALQDHVGGERHVREPVVDMGIDRRANPPVIHGIRTHWIGRRDDGETVSLNFGRYLPADESAWPEGHPPQDGRILSRHVSLPYPRVELIDDDQWACEISTGTGETYLLVGELDEVIADSIDLLEETLDA